MQFKRIKELREERKLTTQQVAETISITPNAYKNYEEGLKDIPASVIVKLGQLYEVSVDYIVDLTDVRK